MNTIFDLLPLIAMTLCAGYILAYLYMLILWRKLPNGDEKWGYTFSVYLGYETIAVVGIVAYCLWLWQAF